MHMNKSVLSLALIVFGLTLPACNDDSPNSPSPTTSSKFTAALLPANEVPPIAGAEAAGSGTATITLNFTNDSNGYVTAATADFSVTTAGFPNGTTLTGAHIHGGNAGTNGGILVSLALAAGEVTFANGGGSFTKTGISITVDQANAIVANPSSFYFNIHTAANVGGVARGQLAVSQ
jgi:hypothetical protein